MGKAAAVVLELAAAAKSQRLRKLVGFAGQLGSVGRDLVQGKAALLGPLQQPRQLTQRQTVEDQRRLGAVGLGPPVIKQLARWDVGLGSHRTLPLALDVDTMRMTLKDQIPQKFVALPMEAFADHLHSFAQYDLVEFGIAQRRCPRFQPSIG